MSTKKALGETIIEERTSKSPVLSDEEAAEVFGAPSAPGKTGKRRQPHVMNSEEEPAGAVVATLADALNRRICTWRTPDAKNPVLVRFRRPRGGTHEMIYRVLGPEQSNNHQLVREYLALSSVVEIDGDEVAQPNSRAKFEMIKRRIGYVGPDEEDWYDEIVSLFVVAFEYAMYPDRFEAMAEAEAAGLSPDDVRRIASMAGLERPKASPAPSS